MPRSPTRRIKRAASALLAALVLHGCASPARTGLQCERNFSTSGSIVSGKTFTTFSVLPDTSPAKAFAKAYQVLLSEGFHIEGADDKQGTITAYQNVDYSVKTAPLNVLVEPAGSGAKLTFVFLAPGGLYTPEAGAMSQFCQMTAQVEE